MGIIVLWNVPGNPIGMFTIQLGNILTGPNGATGSLTTNPIDKTIPGFNAVIGVGIGFSTGLDSQRSVLRIGNGSATDIVSENIGGYDDGTLNKSALTTLGGFGDDPFTNDEDELLDVSSFLTNGQTNITYNVRDISSFYDDVLVAMYFSAPSVAPICTLTGTLNICLGSTTQLSGSGTAASVNPWVSSNPAVATVSNTGLVNSVSEGTVTITYTTSSGCTISDNVVVNAVPETPLLSAVTHPTCVDAMGSFTIVNYNAALGYNVSPSASTTVTGATVFAPEGTYTVVADNGKCISPNSEIKTINPQPAVPVTPELSATSVKPLCPVTTYDLTTLVTNTVPTGASLEFYTSQIPSTTTLVADPTIAPYGTYYAFFINGSCVSQASEAVAVVECSYPVTLVSFTAEKEENIATLKWATTEETNSDRFEIESSINAKIWVKIGTVSSHGESTILRKYNFLDIAPNVGNNYYRLKMIDQDATFAYSSIASIHFAETSETVSVYPNAAENILFVKNIDLKTIKRISFINANGEKVYTTSKVLDQGIDLRHLAEGLYILNLTFNDGRLSVHKVLIDR